MLNEKQLERFKDFFEKKLKPSILKNEDELFKKGQEASAFLSKNGANKDEK